MLRQNRRRDGLSVEVMKSYGSCCWKLCDRRRRCETLRPGQEKVPENTYIVKGRKKNCWNQVLKIKDDVFLPHMFRFINQENSSSSVGQTIEHCQDVQSFNFVDDLLCLIFGSNWGHSWDGGLEGSCHVNNGWPRQAFQFMYHWSYWTSARRWKYPEVWESNRYLFHSLIFLFFTAIVTALKSVPIVVETIWASKESKHMVSVVGRFVAVEDAKLWHLD